MEIALNRESKRKTAAAVSLRGDERTFGSDALSDGVRYPKTCYAFLLDLLGKPFEHPQVQRFRERFPQYEMLSHPERGTVMFRHSEDIVYTVEELVAMILEHAKSVGEHYTEQKIKDAVVTVPAYFSMVRRLNSSRASIPYMFLFGKQICILRVFFNVIFLRDCRQTDKPYWRPPTWPASTCCS